MEAQRTITPLEYSIERLSKEINWLFDNLPPSPERAEAIHHLRKTISFLYKSIAKHN